jgi:hypothetical protein
MPHLDLEGSQALHLLSHPGNLLFQPRGLGRQRL